MPLTFEQLLAIELVNKQAEAACRWVEVTMAESIGSYLGWRTDRGAYDSPLEAVFDLWWYAMQTVRHVTDDIVLLPQFEVTACGNRYRLDFAIEPDGMRKGRLSDAGGVWPKVGVELDGHDYHERTREQVIYRNQRDRDLQASGWLILHYSGSELVRDPVQCILDCYGKADGAFWLAERQFYLSAESAAAKKAGAPTPQGS